MDRLLNLLLKFQKILIFHRNFKPNASLKFDAIVIFFSRMMLSDQKKELNVTRLECLLAL